MSEPAPADPTPLPAKGAAAFTAAMAAYYVAYYIVFGRRLSEYFHDLLRHFEFFRRWF